MQIFCIIEIININIRYYFCRKAYENGEIILWYINRWYYVDGCINKTIYKDIDRKNILNHLSLSLLNNNNDIIDSKYDDKKDIGKNYHIR